MKYTLMAGGKRIRAALVLLFAETFGEKQGAYPFAAAIEMIHAYSLIHDDLPCMDNDDMRRGKPSNHKVFGEAMALLSGDALLSAAFETVLAHAPTTKSTFSALLTLADAAGPKGMIGGQVLDIENEGNDSNINSLIELHTHKTGALISAAACIGTIVGGGNNEQIKKAVEFGDRIGLAFQIMDDVLDVEGDSEVLGKPAGSDETNNKTTFVTLLGLENAKATARKLTERAKESLGAFENAELLYELADYLLQRQN
ncbi:MAG: polyprenyl synthetase family protein [Bacillota bacterium]|nr:polyprenyl synthetase family protein [Bacillota bacterium]